MQIYWKNIIYVDSQNYNLNIQAQFARVWSVVHFIFLRCIYLYIFVGNENDTVTNIPILRCDVFLGVPTIFQQKIT